LNVEKTIEFLLQQQARFDANQARFEENQAKLEANFAKADRRLDRIERGLAQNNRLVARPARTGVTLRSDVRRHEKAVARHDRMMGGIEDKLERPDRPGGQATPAREADSPQRPRGLKVWRVRSQFPLDIVGYSAISFS
jgi:hypothetical protein